MTKCVTFRFPCVARVCITVAPGYHGGPVVASAKLSVIEWISSCRSERNRLHEVQALIASGLLHACAMIGIVVFAVGQPHRVARSDFVGYTACPSHWKVLSPRCLRPSCPIIQRTSIWDRPQGTTRRFHRFEPSQGSHASTPRNDFRRVFGKDDGAIAGSRNASASERQSECTCGTARGFQLNSSGADSRCKPKWQRQWRSLGTAQVASSRESRSSRDAAGSTGAAVSDSDAGLFGAIRGAIQRQVRYPSAARHAGLEGTVYVRLYFASDALTPSLEIARSSGHTDLDEAAVKAVRRSLPLPRPRAALDLTIPIVFQLH